MKDNFFKTFGEIDEKYINEAANTCCEESFAEEIKSTGLRKRIYTLVIKYAACAAVIGAAVFAVSSAAGFGKDDLTPNSTGVSDYDTEISSAQTEAVIQDEAEVTTADFVIYTRCASPDDEIREKAREDWYSRDLTSPTDSELPEYYDTKFGVWSSMFIPAPLGSEVRAISYGEVVFLGRNDTFSDDGIEKNIVMIKQNDYFYTTYIGINPETSLQVGDNVEAGQTVGYADLNYDDVGCGFALDMREWNFITMNPAFIAYESEARVKAREDWNNRTLTEPTDSELPEYYSTQFGGNSSMFIPAPEGSEVKTISDGEIVFMGYREADDEHAISGNYVLVKHNDYVYTGYCGIDPESSLQAGDTVEAGQVIGYADFDFDMQGYGFILEIRESNFINLDLTEMNSEDLNGIEANGEAPAEFHNN